MPAVSRELLFDTLLNLETALFFRNHYFEKCAGCDGIAAERPELSGWAYMSPSQSVTNKRKIMEEKAKWLVSQV